MLRVDRAELNHIPEDVCLLLRRLKSLDLKSNRIRHISNLTECSELRLLDLSNNRIASLKGSLFRYQHSLRDLILSDNFIEEISEDAFIGLESLQILDLMNNLIARIHPTAFLPTIHLEDLNLGNNIFPELPHLGLTNIKQLKIFNNKHLKEFPSPHLFPHIRTLALSYAYHCCEFLPYNNVKASGSADVDEFVLWPSEERIPDATLWNETDADLWPGYGNFTSRFGEFADEIWGGSGPDYTYPANLPQYVEDYFEERGDRYPEITASDRFIRCLPRPGPFMPCEDLFEWWTLRCGIWIVFLLAVLGNGTVVFVLVFSRSKMDVPRFLVCNLALADFFMGIYLAFLAVVDASTLGEFRKHAVRWQNSGACQAAGFLGVLSSELSVFTLAVITLERNYAITHAMHLNKRLSLQHASYVMLSGWTFAVLVASLPLFGISDYRKFAVCLPFETEDKWSLAYVVFLMTVNGAAFIVLVGCYLKMYCAIRGSQAWNSNDSRIAKRMALLVFTDLLCWAPIAFFSLTAAFGVHLVSLEEAKVFTVFVLPLNSCANPFLYAILTKQFKKDCVLICKAIEESRVTRGIGRCRHSSNFSNRHTPANTNSIVDRNSSNNGLPCTCQIKTEPETGRVRKAARFFLCGGDVQHGADEYAYALAEIQRAQERKRNRHCSVSSENFSSSRSDSWRQKGAPFRLLDKRRRNSWTVTRKPSQDSNLSSSRNDSSATTASTSTWRVSRSSVSSDGSGAAKAIKAASPPLKLRARPKLQRQSAVPDDGWPVRAGESENTFRRLTTIKSVSSARAASLSDLPCALLEDTYLLSARRTSLPVPGMARRMEHIVKDDEKERLLRCGSVQIMPDPSLFADATPLIHQQTCSDTNALNN